MTRAGHLDELGVCVECQQGVATDAALRGRLGRDLEASIKATIGVSTTVMVRDPGSLERSGGKAKRVIDKRPR